jgi:hypothetical protein
VATGLALLVAVPNLLWQIRHGLPQLTVGAGLSAENAAEVRISMWPLLLVMIGPLVCWVWIAGIVRLGRNPRWRSMRFLLVAFLVVLVLTFTGGSQFYYPYPMLAVVFTVGCLTVAERLTSRARQTGVVTLFSLHVLTSIAINLPLIPVEQVGRTFIPTANAGVGDQVGWPRYVEQIDAVTVRARSRDPAAVVLTSNYGEAGALNRYSTLPEVPVVSGHNALWFVAAPPEGTRTVVVVGGQLPRVEPFFERCDIDTRLDNGVGVDNEEQDMPVAICTWVRGTWAELWPRFRHVS